MWSREYWQYAGIRTIVNTVLYVRRSAWFSPTTQPDRVKTYACRPNLFACRIFTPREQSDKRPSTLPLVIRTHGGGFVVNNPAADDPLARHLADNARCIVISIDYSKSPQSRFPTAYEDVIAQSLAAIEDPDLPVDRSRVVLCGSSAGGNLMLGAAQDSRLRSKIVGVAAVYPPVDMIGDGPSKMATRPDPTVPDFIGDGFSNIARLYLDEANKPAMTDPRLSPAYFATRDSLPPDVLLIGTEHDMFCAEDEAMAEKLAGQAVGSKVEMKGGWRAPGVQWHKISGQAHAFDAFGAKTPEEEEVRTAAVDELYTTISGWLTEVFSKSHGS